MVSLRIVSQERKREMEGGKTERARELSVSFMQVPSFTNFAFGLSLSFKSWDIFMLIPLFLNHYPQFKLNKKYSAKPNSLFNTYCTRCLVLFV